LKHIVQLYEELEIRVEEIEIENINHKYLEGKDKDQKLIDVHLASLKEKMKKKKQEALENLENEKSKGNTAAL
jgi:formate dehydrogenase maturation protein FdhE